jgi:subtilisin family serine protease
MTLKRAFWIAVAAFIAALSVSGRAGAYPIGTAGKHDLSAGTFRELIVYGRGRRSFRRGWRPRRFAQRARSFRSARQRPSSRAATLLNNKRHRPLELLIEVPNASADQLKQILANQYGVEVRELGVVELIDARIWHLTLVWGQNLQTVLEQLLEDNRVIGVQPNYIYTAVQGSPQDDVPGPYNKAALNVPLDASPAPGVGVKVAIVDSCIDRNHAEIEGTIISFFDAMPSRAQECQAENHGTAVASLIGGHGQLHGPASGALLMSARAFAFNSEKNEVAGTSREVALALNWAMTSGARVINLSFAGPNDPLVERAVAAAHRKGIVLVGAAGNAGPSSEPLYPAAYPEVIAVTATDAKHELYSAANRGSYISVSARGVDVIVAHVNNEYGTDSGTSFAAATVSGIVALMLEKRPSASPDEIRAALQNTATSVTGKGRNESFGYGLVDADAAVAFVESSVSQ